MRWLPLVCIALLLSSCGGVPPAIHDMNVSAPPDVTVPLGKHWSVKAILGGVSGQIGNITVTQAHQNLVDMGLHGQNLDYGGIGAELKWKTEF